MATSRSARLHHSVAPAEAANHTTTLEMTAEVDSREPIKTSLSATNPSVTNLVAAKTSLSATNPSIAKTKPSVANGVDGPHPDGGKCGDNTTQRTDRCRDTYASRGGRHREGRLILQHNSEVI